MMFVTDTYLGGDVARRGMAKAFNVGVFLDDF